MRPILLLFSVLLLIAAAEAPDGPIPVPQPKPNSPAQTSPAATPDADAPVRGQKPEAGGAPESGAKPKADDETQGTLSPDEAACEAELTTMGVSFERTAPVTGEDGCGISPAYRFTGFADGVKLEPAAEMRCETGLALARLVKDTAIPAVAALDAAKAGPERNGKSRRGNTLTLAAVRHASAFVCRPRNNQAGAKMSEHATGRAIDLAAFVLSDGTEIAVEPRGDDHTIAGAFQAAVRGGACLHFTTVLGPGADAHHDDHLHLDLAERRGGYRICQ
jgi:hypothetical protein